MHGVTSVTGDKKIPIVGLMIRLALVTIASLMFVLPSFANQTPKQMYERLVEIDKQEQARIAAAVQGLNIPKIFDAPNFSEESAIKEKLKKMTLSGNADAGFYWGVYEFNQGSKKHEMIFSRSRSPRDREILQEMANEHFKNAMTGLQLASKSGNGDASWNIALLYENGFGVQKSKLSAAEWFAKAGTQYLKQGHREAALAALEQAEGVDPKIPPVIQLRSNLYPQTKK